MAFRSLFLVISIVAASSNAQSNCENRKTCGDCMADAECFWCLDNPTDVASFPKCFSTAQETRCATPDDQQIAMGKLVGVMVRVCF